MILIIATLILIIASLLDGAVEGFDFDGRKYFENWYNVDPFDYWGSKSWMRSETNPNIYNKLNGVFDFYHNADDIRKYGYLSSAFLFALSCPHWLYIVAGIIVSILFKRLGMYLIRRKPETIKT